ncbi:MAG: metallophosphoesterase family protein [Deltaproteobacteria bacterium]|nr:metallophosphoesterase family protein [Deltaproteobacteria bacterium]
MKIGVIADTHLSKPSITLRQLAHGTFSKVDVILHAGDLTSLAVLDVFSNKQTYVVRGHKDPKVIANMLPEHQMIQINGYLIGLIHGPGGSGDIESRLVKFFHNAHCIVYGYTHRPSNHIRSGILMFNPGAFSGKFPFRRNRSIGILTIDKGISGEIIPLKSITKSPQIQTIRGPN